MGINVAIWAIDYYSVKRQDSFYYYNNYPIATTIDITIYTSVTQMFGSDDPNDSLGTTMALIYGWLLWKTPLAVYALHLTSQQESKGMRIGTWIA